MKKIIATLASLITALAGVLSHLSLRGLLLCCGLLLSIGASHLSWFHFLDDLLLRANSLLFETPRGTSEIAIVRVPEAEQLVWQSDIHAAGNLALLLANLLNDADTVVGILLREPIDSGSDAADLLIENYLSESEQAKALVDRKYILQDLLSKKRVVVGVDGFHFSAQQALSVQGSVPAKFPLFVQQLLWPRCSYCLSLEKAVEVARPAIDHRPLLSHGYHRNQRPFYFSALLESERYSGAKEKYESFFITYLKAMQGMSLDAPLQWSPGDKLKIGELQLPLSVSGQFIPLHVLSQRQAPQINEISLSEALARNAFPKYILIASEKNPDAASLAKAIYSAKNGKLFYSPWWGAPLQCVLLLLVTLYVGLVLVHRCARKACTIAAVFVGLLLPGQSLLLYFASIWMPLALILVWFFVGHFVLLVWKIKRQRLRDKLTQ